MLPQETLGDNEPHSVFLFFFTFWVIIIKDGWMRILCFEYISVTFFQVTKNVVGTRLFPAIIIHFPNVSPSSFKKKKFNIRNIVPSQSELKLFFFFF